MLFLKVEDEEEAQLFLLARGEMLPAGGIRPLLMKSWYIGIIFGRDIRQSRFSEGLKFPMPIGWEFCSPGREHINLSELNDGIMNAANYVTNHWNSK